MAIMVLMAPLPIALSAAPPSAASTVMVYVQLHEDDSIHHIALEDGLMSSFFGSGYIVLNARPQEAPLINGDGTHSVWLRSLATDIGANYVLLVTYRPTATEQDIRVDTEYAFLDIARPGILIEGTMRGKHGGPKDSVSSLQKNSYLLGQKIVQQVLTEWN